MRISAGTLLVIALVGCARNVDLPDPHLIAYLVRHAEKAAGPDPTLTEAGQARAIALAETLRHADIDTVYSSDYKRTRETAAPIADMLAVEVQLYDPDHLEALASRLKKTGGRALVVGHSNTTPRLVWLLGGEPGSPIDEASEYDRLYVVTTYANPYVNTDLRRYGQLDQPVQNRE